MRRFLWRPPHVLESPSRRVRSIKAAIFACLVIVFALDLVAPIGNAVGVPYVLVLLLTLFLPDRKSIFRTAALISVLATIGFFSPPPEGPLFSLALKNRLIAMGVVWITAVWGNMLLKEQEATRKERDFNESLVETASSIILLLDPDARILYFNRSTTDLLGYPLSEVKGHDWFETCVPETDRETAREIFRQCLDESIARDCQFTILTRDGEKRQFSWSSKPMRDDGSRDRAAPVRRPGHHLPSRCPAAAGGDGTARGHRANDHGRLSRNPQRTPGPQNGAGNALGDDQRPATSTWFSNTCKTAKARLHRLFEDVRHFAGPLQLERAVVPLNEVWQKAWISVAAAREERDAILKENIGCPHLQCSVDALRIEQVFRNLFENSLAACSDPVSIEISVKAIRHGGKPFLEISVLDNGPGLSHEAKKKVFEPFFTTKPSGTGLGMAISKRILESHGGDLSLDSHPRGGAEFILLLPLAEPANEHEPQNPLNEPENLTVN